jgi:hypothetical protein
VVDSSRTSAWQGWSRDPGVLTMATGDSAGFGGVVAGGSSTEPHHRGGGVRAADDANAVVVGAGLGPTALIPEPEPPVFTPQRLQAPVGA